MGHGRLDSCSLASSPHTPTFTAVLHGGECCQRNITKNTLWYIYLFYMQNFSLHFQGYQSLKLRVLYTKQKHRSLAFQRYITCHVISWRDKVITRGMHSRGLSILNIQIFIMLLMCVVEFRCTSVAGARLNTPVLYDMHMYLPWISS